MKSVLPLLAAALLLPACSSLNSHAGRHERYAAELAQIRHVCIRGNPEKPQTAVYEAFQNSFRKFGITTRVITQYHDDSCPIQLVNGVRMNRLGHIRRGSFALVSLHQRVRTGLSSVAYAYRGQEREKAQAGGLQVQTDTIVAELLNRPLP